MPVAVKSSRFFLCTSLYTAKKSYFALSSLSEFLRASAGCSKKQPVFLYAKIFSLLVLTLSTLLSAISVVIIFCVRVLICTLCVAVGTKSWILQSASAYVVKGQRLNRFGVEAGAGVTFYLSPDVESSVGYEGKFRSHYQDHTGYVSAKYKF